MTGGVPCHGDLSDAVAGTGHRFAGNNAFGNFATTV